MFLIADDALETFVNASVQRMVGNTVLAGDGASGGSIRGGLGRCHYEDEDGR